MVMVIIYGNPEQRKGPILRRGLLPRIGAAYLPKRYTRPLCRRRLFCFAPLKWVYRYSSWIARNATWRVNWKSAPPPHVIANEFTDADGKPVRLAGGLARPKNHLAYGGKAS